MLFLFRSAPEVEKRIHSKLFRKFWRSRGTKEPAYITVVVLYSNWLLSFSHGVVSFSTKVILFFKGAMLMALSDEMVAALMRLRNIREDKNERIKRKYEGRRNITEEKSAQHWWW